MANPHMSCSHLEPVFSASPIFHAFQTGVIIFEKVGKVNSHGAVQDRHLVIATSGIFLLKHRNFPRGYIVSRSIGLSDITGLAVTRDNFTVRSDKMIKSTMTIKHSKCIFLAARLHSLRQMFFNHSSFSYTLEIDPGTREQFDSNQYQYTCESVLAERFVGCILHHRSEFLEQLMKEAYDTLKEFDDNADISPEILSNPYIGAVIMAIATDTTLRSVRIKNVQMNALAPYFRQLIQNSTSIERFVLSYVSFQPSLKELEGAFESTLSRSNTYIFDNCNFQYPESASFFESFSDYQAQIKHLAFQKCKFSQGVLDSLFQSIFFFQCFHTLETLQINDIGYPEDLMINLRQLSCCGWVLETHCLLHLSITNSGIELGQILPELLHFDAGILTIDFGSNLISKPLPHVDSFQSICNLGLSGCTFGDGAIASVFRTIAHAKTHGISLDLSSAKVTNWGDFYSCCTTLVVPTLEGLIWDFNPMIPSQLMSFSIFIKKQPQLKELSISNCFAKSEMKSSLPLLLDLIYHKPFESFSFEGSSDRFLGPSIAQLIDSLLIQRRIVRLNIANQKVGENVMLMIADQIPPSLKEIRFSNFAPSSADSLIDVCERLLHKSQLRFISWPTADEKSVLSKTDRSVKTAKTQKLMQLRASFVAKFGKESTMNESDVESFMVKSPSGRKVIPSNGSSSLESRASTSNKIQSKIKDGLAEMKEHVDYDQETLGLLAECGDVIGEDPIVALMQRIDDETTISLLLKGLPQ